MPPGRLESRLAVPRPVSHLSRLEPLAQLECRLTRLECRLRLKCPDWLSRLGPPCLRESRMPRMQLAPRLLEPRLLRLPIRFGPKV